jgi:hypothetical protein
MMQLLHSGTYIHMHTLFRRRSFSRRQLTSATVSQQTICLGCFTLELACSRIISRSSYIQDSYMCSMYMHMYMHVRMRFSESFGRQYVCASQVCKQYSKVCLFICVCVHVLILVCPAINTNRPQVCIFQLQPLQSCFVSVSQLRGFLTCMRAGIRLGCEGCQTWRVRCCHDCRTMLRIRPRHSPGSPARHTGT